MSRLGVAQCVCAACPVLAAALGATCIPTLNPQPPPPLEHEYLGRIDLLYEQDLPAISELVQMEVQVDRQGIMTIQPGVLAYDAESIEEDVRLRRSGTINLAPTGARFDNNGVDSFSVNEHGTGQDRIQQWVFDGVTWQLVLDQTTAVSWTGGLAFSLDDAVLNGSVIQADAGLYRVRWTLTLSPVLQ